MHRFVKLAAGLANRRKIGCFTVYIRRQEEKFKSKRLVENCLTSNLPY